MKNLLVATIGHNTEDRRIKIVCRKHILKEGCKAYNYKWYEDETGLEVGLPPETDLWHAKNNVIKAYSNQWWNLKHNWTM